VPTESSARAAGESRGDRREFRGDRRRTTGGEGVDWYSVAQARARRDRALQRRRERQEALELSRKRQAARGNLLGRLTQSVWHDLGDTRSDQVLFGGVPAQQMRCCPSLPVAGPLHVAAFC